MDALTDQGKLELAFDVTLDGAVVDGCALAHSLIQTAYRLLLPYANGCPACADALFSALANDAIAMQLGDVHERRADAGSYYVLTGDDTEKRAAFAAHLDATKERTAALIQDDAPSAEARHLH